MKPVAISYSGGTSSEWLVQAVLRGVLSSPDTPLAVFFADTGEEHDWTYRAVDRVEDNCRERGVTFIRCHHPRWRRLGDHILESLASGATRIDQPPVFIDKGLSRGQAPQRCSREFKRAVLRRAQSRWLKSIGRRKSIETWIGFAADEPGRASIAVSKRDVKWESLRFPAIAMGKTRADQRRELVEWVGSAPAFSMCVCCPWKTPERWAATRGADRERAIQIDDGIRDLGQIGLDAGPAYLCDRLVPIRSLKVTDEFIGESKPDVGCDGGRCFL